MFETRQPSGSSQALPIGDKLAIRTGKKRNEGALAIRVRDRNFFLFGSCRAESIPFDTAQDTPLSLEVLKIDTSIAVGDLRPFMWSFSSGLFSSWCLFNWGFALYWIRRSMGRCIRVFSCTLIACAICGTCTIAYFASDSLPHDMITRAGMERFRSGGGLSAKVVSIRKDGKQFVGRGASRRQAPSKPKAASPWRKATGHLIVGLCFVYLGVLHGYNEAEWLRGGQQPGADTERGYISGAMQAGLPLFLGIFQLVKFVTTVSVGAVSEVRRSVSKAPCKSQKASVRVRSGGATQRPMARKHVESRRG